MPNSDWRGVVERLNESIGAPTPAQTDLAVRLDVILSSDAPRPVAAALLHAQVRDALGEPVPGAPSDEQLEYLTDLAAQTGLTIPEVEDTDMLDAWLRVAFARRAAQALAALEPEPGDVVQLKGPEGDEVYCEIASISDDGKLNFRGAASLRARPHVVTMALRAAVADKDNGLLYAARQYATTRRTNADQSSGDRSGLDRWAVSAAISPGAISAVQDALDTAADEKPLQDVLARFPEVLACTVAGHHGRWVIPHPRLGDEYIPDFFIASETSAGIRWTLVELESPTVRLHVNDGGPRKELRHDIQQVEDWQEWLGTNLDKARRRVSDGGLGYTGIRPDAQGVVIIGRGELTSVTDVMRARWLKRGVEIRSYDWLLRAAQTNLHSGFGLFSVETEQVDDDWQLD